MQQPPELISCSRSSVSSLMEPEPEPEPELISCSPSSLSSLLEPDPELISLITRLIFGEYSAEWDRDSKFITHMTRIVRLVKSMDLDSQPKPETELMSLVTQTISLFNSLDLESQPKPLCNLISNITQHFNLTGGDLYWHASVESTREFYSIVAETLHLEPEPELMSLIHQIFSLVNSMNSNRDKLISLCPQAQVSFMEQGIFHVNEQVSWSSNNKWDCLPLRWEKFTLTGGEDGDDTHFLCRGCNGENHKEEDYYNKAPVEIKHSLHKKHSLKLVLLRGVNKTRKCYCCDEDLIKIFYYCSACDYAMNIACVEKAPLALSINLSKWHDHTLALFPRKSSLTCDLCALADSSCPFYICPPCDFLVHQSCISLPRVIRISRHLHRISFIPSFNQGDWSCSVCRKKIDNDYGGYSCIKDICSYKAHSRCATQSNVWDGIELEGVPEDIEEEVVEPFVRISDGIIQHFSHRQHHLKLDENTCRDYDDNKQCQACITPIYFGNFYSCMECDFILHEECANFSTKIHHPIHPHPLYLVTDYYGEDKFDPTSCSACSLLRTCCFFYECFNRECDFKIHMQCATVSEPLVHRSHMHPLFLTSKPEEKRTCSVCKVPGGNYVTNETFNCIECDYFALCFRCATLPQKVRYKHDKHMLTLSYGDEASNMTYWCEVCERGINPKKRFYTCDEYCCVTLHIECLLGKDLYVKPGSLVSHNGFDLLVLLNNHHTSRPFCQGCKKRCLYNVVFRWAEYTFCSTQCVFPLAMGI